MRSFAHILSFILLGLTAANATPLPRYYNPSARTLSTDEAVAEPDSVARRQDVVVNSGDIIQVQNSAHSTNNAKGRVLDSGVTLTSGIGNAVNAEDYLIIGTQSVYVGDSQNSYQETPIEIVETEGNMVIERDRVNGAGDQGGAVEDVEDHALTPAHGDSYFTRNNNHLESVTSSFGGASKDLLLRAIPETADEVAAAIANVDPASSNNGDQSFTNVGLTFGDSFNSGTGNTFSPINSIGGISGTGISKSLQL